MSLVRRMDAKHLIHFAQTMIILAWIQMHHSNIERDIVLLATAGGLHATR